MEEVPPFLAVEEAGSDGPTDPDLHELLVDLIGSGSVSSNPPGHGAPMILIGGTVPGDVPGMRMLDSDFEFSEQDDDLLTIAGDHVNGPDRGVGLGGFIVGTDSTFTVFAQLRSQLASDGARSVQVISGRLRPQGIADLHVAGFMLNNYGNPRPDDDLTLIQPRVLAVLPDWSPAGGRPGALPRVEYRSQEVRRRRVRSRAARRSRRRT